MARSRRAKPTSGRSRTATAPPGRSERWGVRGAISGPSWSTGMREVGAGIFAYVQATGETGISNAGLIVGRDGAVAVDALMVPSMTRRLVAAIKKTTSRRIGALINTHHHLDHTGGNQFFRSATIVASAKCREAHGPRLSAGATAPAVHAARSPASFPLLKMTLPDGDLRGPAGDPRRRAARSTCGIRACRLTPRATPPCSCRRSACCSPGDLAFHYVTPLAFQGHVGHWIEAADRVLELRRPTWSCRATARSGPSQDVRLLRDYLVLVRPGVEAPVRRRDAGRRPPRATSSSACTPAWREAERILPNVMRCYQEFRNETDQDLDVKAMIEGMERLRGSSTGHACL